MFKIKVVSAEEMATVEALAIKAGASAEKFMEQAGKAIAGKVESLFPLKSCGKKISAILPTKKIVLLAGKGNNGGDGFTLGRFLLKKGYAVRAMLFFDPSAFSGLCLKNFKLFKKAGGLCKKVLSCADLTFGPDEILVDAIFGTGFQGKVDSSLALLIKNINLSKNIKISIDIPSGLNGNDGLADDAIVADHTVYLALPKSGFFLNEGWKHVGKLHKVGFGLKEKYIEKAAPKFFLIEGDIKSELPAIVRTRDKYEAGYVSAISGSLGMEGAADLSGKAALRSGAGIVKIFISGDHSKAMTDELVKIKLDLSEPRREEILAECNKSSSVYIGPGIGRSQEMAELLKYLLPKITVPLVLDADGLYFFARNPRCPLPKDIIMTPHKLEMVRLLNKKELSHIELLDETQKFCELHKAIIVLKGAPTFIFRSGEKPSIIIEGDPGMATAGSGDVLTGVIAALLAQGLDPAKAAEAGVFIHGKAGEAAAGDKSSYSMIASDIIDHLSDIFQSTDPTSCC